MTVPPGARIRVTLPVSLYNQLLEEAVGRQVSPDLLVRRAVQLYLEQLTRPVPWWRRSRVVR